MWLHIHTGSVPCPEAVLLRTATGAADVRDAALVLADREAEPDGDGLGELLAEGTEDADAVAVGRGAAAFCPPALQATSTPSAIAHPAPITAGRQPLIPPIDPPQ
jgi:hypothetical protein